MGKKYIIEIDEEPFTKDGNKLYRASKFASLVFDSYGLSMLEEYKEPELEPTLRVGDLVLTEGGSKIVVTYLDEIYFGGFGIQPDGSDCITWVGIGRNRIRKILRHYSCIADILEDLKP